MQKLLLATLLFFTFLPTPMAQSYDMGIAQFVTLFEQKLGFYSDNSATLITMPVVQSFNADSNIAIIEPYNHLRLAILSSKMTGMVESVTLVVTEPFEAKNQRDFSIFATTLIMSLNPTLQAENAVNLLSLLENYDTEPLSYNNQFFQLFLTDASFGLVASKKLNKPT